MLADKLKKGDTIGLISPSAVASEKKYAKIISGIEARGFRVKIGRNFYKDTYGYLAGERERADDLNRMAADKEVKLIFFGGGSGSIELLPYIDYETIKRNPKLFLSYSDGTSILNAIYARTGLITYYGQTPVDFAGLTKYNARQFSSHLIKGDAEIFRSNSRWYTLHPGSCRGILVGGYTLNTALAVDTRYFCMDADKKYILFLEDHEKFNSVAAVSMLLSRIEQSPSAKNIVGLLFGHYAERLCTDLLKRLARFGEEHGVPVVYCDDFGHGANHAILPIGMNAEFDGGKRTMLFKSP